MTDSLNKFAALAGAGRFDAALRAVIALEPGGGRTPVALFRQGALALKRNDAFQAVALFQQVAALDPDFPALTDALASAYRRDARYEECLATAHGGQGSRQAAYEAGLSLIALGRGRDALACFDAILADDPGHAASWFASHAPALAVHGLAAAEDRLIRAVGCPGANGRYHAFLAAYALLDGRDDQAGRIIDRHIAAHPARRALVDGILAIRPHCRAGMPVLGLSADMLRLAVDRAILPGLVLEFGVRRGTSIRVLAAHAGQDVHGFDSFEGLPLDWGDQPAGLLTTGACLPDVPDSVTLHAGWFQDTLPPFLSAREGDVRLVNIDSDIYASARFVLSHLAGRLKPGSIVIFDEFIGNQGWAEDEYKAFMDHVAETGTGFSILAVAPYTKQVVIRIDAHDA